MISDEIGDVIAVSTPLTKLNGCEYLEDTVVVPVTSKDEPVIVLLIRGTILAMYVSQLRHSSVTNSCEMVVAVKLRIPAEGGIAKEYLFVVDGCSRKSNLGVVELHGALPFGCGILNLMYL
jgi:hypothetical protein